MNLTISVLIVGLVIFPLISATGTSSSNSNNAKADEPKAVTHEEADDLDLSDIISIFGNGNEDYSEIKRSSSELIDMETAASEKEYHWKTVKPNNAKKASSSNSNNNGKQQQQQGLITSGGKVYTLHIVTNDDSHENLFNNNNNNKHNKNTNLSKNRIRTVKGGGGFNVHRSIQKSDRGKTKIIKRFRPSSKNEDQPIKYDSHTHSEEIQEIVLPSGSEIVEGKYDNNYDVIHPTDLKENDIKQENTLGYEETHYPVELPAEKVKVKHHHHHHHHNHVKTVIKKVPQPYPVEKVVHVPVEKIVHVPKPYPVDKFVEKLVHVPVERVIHVPKPVPVDRVVEKIVHVPKPYPVDRIVEKPMPYEKEVKVPVRVNVPYPVDRIVHVPRPYPVEKVVEKFIHVPKPYPVFRNIHVPVPVEVKVPVKVEVEKQVPVPVKVEKKVPYPVKVEVEKKVPYPVKVYIPKPYPVEKKVPYPVETKPKRPFKYYFDNQPQNHGHHTHYMINHHHNQQQQQQQQQQQESQQNHQQMGGSGSGSQTTGYGGEQSYAGTMSGSDYYQQQQSQQQQQTQNYPYQYDDGQTEIQYGINMMASQPTGEGSDNQDYVYDHEGQARIRQVSSSDSQDAASEAVSSISHGGPTFQITVPEQQGSRDPMQYGESKTVSHLLQITPINEKPMSMTRPVDQFVVFHTGAGFSVQK